MPYESIISMVLLQSSERMKKELHLYVDMID